MFRHIGVKRLYLNCDSLGLAVQLVDRRAGVGTLRLITRNFFDAYLHAKILRDSSEMGLTEHGEYDCLSIGDMLRLCSPGVSVKHRYRRAIRHTMRIIMSIKETSLSRSLSYSPRCSIGRCGVFDVQLTSTGYLRLEQTSKLLSSRLLNTRNNVPK
jgi:hypothetical protein